MPSRGSIAELLPLFSIQGSLEDYLVRVTDYCRDAFSADGVSLFLRIEGTDTLVLAAQAGTSAKLPWSAAITIGSGLAGASAADGIPRSHKGPIEASAHPLKEAIEASMIVPLITLEAETVGVLNVFRLCAREAFTHHELQRAEAIARHLALAVDNASLIARHRADAERYASLADQNQRILESLPSGVVALDRAGRILQANDSALRLLRRNSKRAPRDWPELARKLSPEGRAEVDRSLASAAEGRESRVAISEPDGRHLLVKATPGAQNGVTLVIEDVTHDVERERELQRTKTLAEIGQMTSAIAHEIRNPLTSIRGAAQMMRDEPSVDGARNWAKIVEQEALELNELCDAFLDFARNVALNLGEVDIERLVRDLLAQMKGEMTKAKVTAQFTGSGVSTPILADGFKLGQALRNLFKNAVEAMPNGGKVLVRVEARKKYVEIEVADQGIGISEDNLARLFTPFFTTKSRGTGLGLCNVQRVVAAHGGTVTVESQLGAGSTFALRLPTRSQS